MNTERKTKGKADEVDVYAGIQLRALRTARGYSQERLADIIGVTFQQVQKYERGTNRISVGMLHKICRALKVKAENFFPTNDNGTDEALNKHHLKILKVCKNVKPEQLHNLRMAVSLVVKS